MNNNNKPMSKLKNIFLRELYIMILFCDTNIAEYLRYEQFYFHFSQQLKLLKPSHI